MARRLRLPCLGGATGGADDKAADEADLLMQELNKNQSEAKTPNPENAKPLN